MRAELSDFHTITGFMSVYVSQLCFHIIPQICTYYIFTILFYLILIFCVPLNPNKTYRTFYQKCIKFIIVICTINFNYVVNDR